MLIRDAYLQTFGDRSVPLYKHTQKKRSRKSVAWSSNLTASLGGETEALSQKEAIKRVTHHAFMRLQTMTLVGAVFEATKYGASPELAPTIYQGGSSSLDDYSAAHCCLTPHITSQSRSSCIERIFANGLSTVDEIVLKAKGATSSDIKAICSGSLSLAELTERIEGFWETESLFEGSWLERRVMSICHQMPHAINCEIDLRLENQLRGFSLDIYGDIASGSISTMKGIAKIASALREELLSMVQVANERLQNLRKVEKFRKKVLKIVKFVKKSGYLSAKYETRLVTLCKQWKDASLAVMKHSLKAPPAYFDKNVDMYEHLLDLDETLKSYKGKRKRSDHIREVVMSLPTAKMTKGVTRELQNNRRWFESYAQFCDAQRRGSTYSEKVFLTYFGKLNPLTGDRTKLKPKEFAVEALYGLQSFNVLDD